MKGERGTIATVMFHSNQGVEWYHVRPHSLTPWKGNPKTTATTYYWWTDLTEEISEEIPYWRNFRTADSTAILCYDEEFGFVWLQYFCSRNWNFKSQCFFRSKAIVKKAANQLKEAESTNAFLTLRACGFPVSEILELDLIREGSLSSSKTILRQLGMMMKNEEADLTSYGRKVCIHNLTYFTEMYT